MFYTEMFLSCIGHHAMNPEQQRCQTANIQALAKYLPSYLATYQINTDQRQAHFLGQLYVESHFFSKTEESLSYKRSRFDTVFPKRAHEYDARFLDATRKGQIHTSQDRQRLIGNVAYHNKNGNGDFDSDEGYKYRGRGFIQITGRSNYEVASQMSGVDFLNQPGLLAEPRYALLSACCYWQANHINSYADRNDYLGVTHSINRANLNFVERREYTVKIQDMQKTWNGVFVGD